MNFYEKIKTLSENRIAFFLEKNHEWYNGSGTYFSELVEEVAEAAIENKENNKVYLENELGDVFWDYICLLNSLKVEWKIDSIDSVLKRSYDKFSERSWVDGRGMIPWDEIKKTQKLKLEKEHNNMYGEK